MSHSTGATDPQQPVVDFLADPSSHGAGIDTVERVETHCAIVFLAGDRAIKLKRAVRFSYLDYSTPARRRRACEAELRLNRRTAPDLYLEVAPIRQRPDGQLGFDGDGPAVDWVLVMRRFDQAALFDRMAQDGRLDATLMRDLADRIATFHGSARRTPGFGGVDGVEDVIDGNTLNLRRSGLNATRSAAIERLDGRSRAALGAVAGLLEARRQAGKVRHCHGDLHLRNICLLDGVPTLFDGIEFSQWIASTDVLYDLAFLLMDLVHRRLPALANAVLNRYLDMTAEGHGLAAMPLFLSARAAIRAHVEAAAAERQTAPDLRAALEREAAAYLDLAGRLLDPPAPRLVAIGGLSGTGKSTVARHLGPGLGAPPGGRILRSDVVRKRLWGVSPETKLPASAYEPTVSRRVYRALRREAMYALAAGCTVIVDAVFDDAAERRALAALAAACGVRFDGFWLTAPRPALEARLRGRRDDASDATVAVLDRQLARDTGPVAWMPVDAGGPSGTVAATIRRRLDAGATQGRGHAPEEDPATG